MLFAGKSPLPVAAHVARMCTALHTPVLVDEVVSAFKHLRPSSVVVDCTTGHGGHTAALLDADPTLTVLCVDRDPVVLERAMGRLASYGDRVRFQCSSYAMLPEVLQRAELPPVVDGLLADLGVSNHHLDDPTRGFSFRSLGRLDMRFDASDASTKTAGHLVNRLSKAQLEELFRVHGGCVYASEVAAGIVEWRGHGRHRRHLKTTIELRHVIDSAVSRAIHGAPAVADRVERRSRIWKQDRRGRWLSRAKRDREVARVVASKPDNTADVVQCFQALRIAVNSELDHLDALLGVVPAHLAPGGVFAAIAFQPDESAKLTAALDDWTKRCTRASCCGELHPFCRLTEEPIRADKAEFKRNPRSRSAHLFTAQRACKADLSPSVASMRPPVPAAPLHTMAGARHARMFHSTPPAAARRGSERQRAALRALEERRAAEAARGAQADVPAGAPFTSAPAQPRERTPAEDLADTVDNIDWADPQARREALDHLSATVSKVEEESAAVAAAATDAAAAGDMEAFERLMQEATSMLDVKAFDSMNPEQLESLANSVPDTAEYNMDTIFKELGIDPAAPQPEQLQALLDATGVSSPDLDIDLDGMLKSLNADISLDMEVPAEAQAKLDNMFEDVGEDLFDEDNPEALEKFKAQLKAMGIEDADLEFDSEDWSDTDADDDDARRAVSEALRGDADADILSSLRDRMEAGSGLDEFVKEAEWTPKKE